MNTELSVRTQQPTGAFVFASWVALLVGALTYMVGLWNATLAMSEKGFYGMAFCLALFSAIAVQKNIRDLAPYKKAEAMSKLDDAGAEA